jgi:hypothetical protein
MMRRRGFPRLLAVLAMAAWLVPAGSAGAQLPGAGFDLFETDPGSTQFTLEISPVNDPPTLVPPGFFGPGSDPLTGEIHFGGVPIETFAGQLVGDTDTVVQRHDPSPLSPPGLIPVELVGLSLQSMEPINVTYNGGQSPEPWIVDVSPSPNPPSLGNIFVEEQGNVFYSQLRVIPLFEFTRVSDGAKRSLDVGALPPGNQASPLFIQNDAPWRPGCVPPALAVPGLNDGFCPGLTPGGEKKLTVEQALLASHGVYPAQPALEHFQCYSLKRSRFKARTVRLSDQFGDRKARVARRAELCNPVRKNNEPLLNRRAHLQCYGTRGPALNRLVAVQNQFGSQRLLVMAPRRLCVPSEKRIVRRRKTRRFPRIQTQIDHFQCYAVSPQSPLWTVQRVRGVKLTDQFGRRGTKLGKPFQLCAPVRKVWKKRVTPIQHPVRHLLCYRVKPRKVRRLVQIRNQFERRFLVTRKSVALCVPTNKLAL